MKTVTVLLPDGTYAASLTFITEGKADIALRMNCRLFIPRDGDTYDYSSLDGEREEKEGEA